jgi:hypothetical protein
LAASLQNFTLRVCAGWRILLESAMFFYPWYPAMMLAFEAGSVIDLRLWKIAHSCPTAAATFASAWLNSWIS